VPTREERAAWGRKGGLTTAARGSAYMSEIAKVGFAKLVEKCNGDAKAARRFLRDRGKFGQHNELGNYYKHIAATGNVDLTFDQYEKGKR